MKSQDIPAILLIIAMFAVSFILVPSMPEKIPMHWNAAGEVDKTGGVESLFIIPIVALLLFGLFTYLPTLAVEKKHIMEFYKKHGMGFKLVFIAFMAAIQAIIILTALGYDIQMNFFMALLLGGLFAYLGYVLKDVKRNYFIGIRTPWALASDKNWKATHEFGSKAYMLAGVVTAVIGILGLPILWTVAAILLASVAAVVKSYLVFKK